MVIALLIIIAGLLGFLIYDLEKFLPHYLDKKLDEHFKKNETILNSIHHCILHSKSKEELQRIQNRENGTYNRENYVNNWKWEDKWKVKNKTK